MKSIIKLHKDIFSFEKISHTIEAFLEIAQIDVFTKKEYYICVFSYCKYDVQKTINEFFNYLIDISNSQE